MSGHIARKGFYFQDLYLLLRVLKAAGDSLESAWRSGSSDVNTSLNSLSLQFGLEASASPTSNDLSDSASLDWDVLVFGESKLEFAEVKSGAITKTDRIAFWRRLRRELTRDSQRSLSLVPILVVDPSKSDVLDKWQKLAEIAAASSALPPSQEPTGNVLTANQLLEEALWWMCHPDGSPDGSDPAAHPIRANEALSRFELHCYEAQSLESQVLQLIELLFPGGLTDTQHNLLMGWLSKRARSINEQRRLFSIRELLQEVGILQEAISLAPGTLKNWRVLWNEVPLGVQTRTRLCLGEGGASVPASRVQPSALEVLTSGNDRALIILGPGGAGKSTFLAQAANAVDLQSDEILHCGADDVTIDELEQLASAIRFRAALMALRRPEARLFLCIDGLDEADGTLRKRWPQLLVRIASFRNVRTLVSMRDAVWRTDGDVRKELVSWTVISLDLWPESIVRELLAETSLKAVLPPSVVDLLRTPILLDLFWRTFVETSAPNIFRASRLQTRHSLLAAFWDERLLNSPRHAGTSEIASRINDVVSRSATSVGGFSDGNLDPVGVQMLLSEGVLVREGRLQPHLRFRHPLLRDFALAQWCLTANGTSELARRWSSIQGGLQRHGALRAIFEALSDPDAQTEYPSLTLGAVVQAIVSSDQRLATQVAHVLGTREPVPGVDPANWPASVQSLLPTEFARDLLSAARLDRNGAWAALLEKWPDDVSWFNKDYPTEVWQYALFLSEQSRANPGDANIREQSRQAARKLRSLSEAPRFASEFSESERWLKMQAILCVIPALPDLATFEWVEREMPQSSWRTRSFLLEKLTYLARIDAVRAAVIYRKAVGLAQRDGRPVLDASVWFGNMDHQAIEWSLAGEDGRKSLLNDHPAAFLPVALDLAEALWMQKSETFRQEEPDWSQLTHRGDSSRSREEHEQRADERQRRLGELIDDSPGWRYWQSVPTGDPYDRCVKAVRECVEHLAKQAPALFRSVARILRSSPIASIHLILFEGLLESEQVPELLALLREIVLDSRLYFVFGIEYWIEQGLTIVWPILVREDRHRVLELLRELLALDDTEENARHYLARLPEADLPDDLRSKRPAESDESYRARQCPIREDFGVSSTWAPVEPDELEIEIGQWPENFDRELLRDFARSTGSFFKQGISAEKLKEGVFTSIEKAKALLPMFQAHAELLEDHTRFWVWQGLAQMLACFRRTRAAESDEPDADAVLGCTELALGVLKNVPAELPGKLPEGDVWSGYRETGWVHALRLADEALTWPPAADDQRIQSQFVEVIKAAFATDHPVVQLVCSIRIRSWHWFRTAERHEMHDQLVWQRQKHASVLDWSLQRLQDLADVDRARIFRLLLNRSDLATANHLANRLGHFVGAQSMVVFLDGQRSVAAEVARETIDSPLAFPFLQSTSNRSEFFRGLIFGMKERVKLIATIHPHLATDYGDWALKMWRIMRAQRKKRHESEGIVLLAMHWLEQKGERAETMLLKPWWQHLQPLLAAVIREGGRPDCFTLFFSLRNGEYNYLTTPEELLGLIEVFIERIRSGALVGAMVLDERNPAEDDYSSWRQCANHAAETIDSLRNDGSLRTDLHREQAHRLLSTLAAEPIRSSSAIAALHSLQNE